MKNYSQFIPFEQLVDLIISQVVNMTKGKNIRT